MYAYMYIHIYIYICISSTPRHSTSAWWHIDDIDSLHHTKTYKNNSSFCSLLLSLLMYIDNCACRNKHLSQPWCPRFPLTRIDPMTQCHQNSPKIIQNNQTYSRIRPCAVEWTRTTETVRDRLAASAMQHWAQIVPSMSQKFSRNTMKHCCFMLFPLLCTWLKHDKTW